VPDPAGSEPQTVTATQPGTVTAQTAPSTQETPSTPAATGEAVVNCVDLTLSFGQRAVLSDLQIPFGGGRVTAILGPTGSGKSTLLRTINRLNDKVTGYGHKGDVLLDGSSIWAQHVELMALRRKVGMLFQRPNPFPMSIMDNVVAGVKAHKMAKGSQLKEIAERRLREVGLWDAVSARLKDSPFRLSGGQQQLLCLARTLAVDPDPMATESIEALVRALVPDLTVIIVTHNLAQARRVSDSTVFLNKGRLVEHGETTQIFENPVQEETARYVTGRFG
jgi:phosphate transport system ATP-binding protein